MSSLDEEIAFKLRQAELAGELKRAHDFGKPSVEDAGWLATPTALRMPFKILKDAGFAPPEIALFHERAALVEKLKSAVDGNARDAVQRQLSELEVKIAFVGGQAEKIGLGKTEEEVGRQVEFLKKWLKEH